MSVLKIPPLTSFGRNDKGRLFSQLLVVSEFETVLQRCRLVEDEVVRGTVRILVEVADTFKLDRYPRIILKESRFGISLCYHKGVRIEI